MRLLDGTFLSVLLLLDNLDQSVQHGYREPEKNPVKAGTGRGRFEILKLQVSQTRPDTHLTRSRKTWFLNFWMMKLIKTPILPNCKVPNDLSHEVKSKFEFEEKKFSLLLKVAFSRQKRPQTPLFSNKLNSFPQLDNSE